MSISTYPVLDGELQILKAHTGSSVQNFINSLTWYLKSGMSNIPVLLYKYFLQVTGFFIPLFAVFGIFKMESKWKWVLSGHFGLLVLFYNFHPGLGWPYYGARYWYSGLSSVVILGMFGFVSFFEFVKNSSYRFYLVGSLVCINVVFGIVFFNEYSRRFHIKSEIIADIQTTCAENSIVVLDFENASVVKDTCGPYVSFIDVGGERRNMFMDGSRLICYLNDSNVDLFQIRRDFPTHDICHYDYSILSNLLVY
jgi:hypothetical protein